MEAPSYVFNLAVGILAALFYLCVAPLLALGLVISIAEDSDSWGTRALENAPDLIKGREIHGFVLAITLALLSAPICVMFYVTSTDDDDQIGASTQFAFMFVATVFFCLTIFCAYSVFTVFYHECKHSKIQIQSMDRDDSTLGTELGPGYHLVSTVIHADIES